MKRQISSSKTFALKIIVPGIFVINCAVMPLAIFSGSSEKRPPLPTLILISATFFAFAVVACLITRKFKKVSVDDEFLYVSNYLKEISMPLSDIADVAETVWIKGAPVTIRLKNASAFGEKITFMPKLRGLNPFAAQTIVSELKELAKMKI